MLASAVRRYLNRYAVRAGRRAVVLTNNDSAYRTALDLQAAGTAVTRGRPAPAHRRRARPRRREAAGIELLPGHAITATSGQRRVASVEVRALDRARAMPSRAPRAPSPATWSASPAAGTRRSTCNPSRARSPSTTPSAASSCPARRSRPSARPAPATAPSRSRACLEEGARAGAAAAEAAGFDAEAARAAGLRRARRGAAPPALAGAVAAARCARARCSSICRTTSPPPTSRSALREGYRSIEHVKRYTTTGMGTDQGKTSNVNALQHRRRDHRPAGRRARRHHLPPAVYAGAVRRDRRPQLRRLLRPRAPHPDARVARGGGRGVRGRRPVEAALVLPAPGRGHGRRGRARGRGRAEPRSASSTPRRSARSTSRAATPPSCSTASTPTPGASSRSAAAATA